MSNAGQQLQLLLELQPITKLTDPTIRNFHGYHQYQEHDASNRKYWKFHVTGFDDSYSGQAGCCHVLKYDGTTEEVVIDKRDRVLINGRFYSRSKWTH